MTEILILNYFLFVAFVLGPLMTKEFFLKGSGIYSASHLVALLILLCGVLLNLSYTVFVWPMFCAFGCFLYLKGESKFIFTRQGVAGCIPFIFSLISSVWFVAGSLNLHLLGYGKAWSFYAAIHGCFLGWILVGCFAFLSGRQKSGNPYLYGVYLSFLFFLFVAFGIDGVPYIKRIGVLGFYLLIPFLIGHYTFSLRKENRISLFLSAVSFFLIFASMTLATLNEFWSGFPKIIAGIPIMVLTHGLMNALLAVPCLYLAIKLEKKRVL